MEPEVEALVDAEELPDVEAELERELEADVEAEVEADVEIEVLPGSTGLSTPKVCQAPRTIVSWPSSVKLRFCHSHRIRIRSVLLGSMALSVGLQETSSALKVYCFPVSRA